MAISDILKKLQQNQDPDMPTSQPGLRDSTESRLSAQAALDEFVSRKRGKYKKNQNGRPEGEDIFDLPNT